MSIRNRNEKEIFETAVKLDGPEDRVAYLDSVCGGDPAYKARILALLQAHESGRHIIDPLADEPDISPASGLAETSCTVIGRYKLLEKIGEGGMAVVYMAEQTEPIRRKVALKVIKLGMDTRQVIARFEAERQALALMDHPSIAKVLDAGATETGRPYFVMELVQGVSITEYCDKNSLSTKDRLHLFLQVCHAVQHAHQKGIIHRDIKPSNVMVTHRDGKPVPKVIDFGVAKATNQRLTEKTLFTRYAHIIGTPAYMSPEQAELSDLDIDTRSDVYSLGVLLYELLTGTTPFSEEELRKAGYIEMQRVIREQEPIRPSTKLSTLGGTLTDIAKRRNSTPDLLRKGIRGDLDWIVMKSLEKDRARRYETATGLAEDIRRHLKHEPVVARGPSTTYRLCKFLRRHRAQTIAALAVVLLAGAVVGVLSLRNRDRLRLAEADALRERAILSQAREQYAQADREAALDTIKPILDGKHVGPEAHLLQASILADSQRTDEAVTVLGRLLKERPAVAGAAHALLARILWESETLDAEKLNAFDEHHRKAEALLPETAEAYFLRALMAPTVKDQLAALDKALQLDPDHYESRRQRAFTYYASRKYERMRDDALGMTYLRRHDPLGYSLRAVALRELGQYVDAIAEYDHAITLTPEGSPQHLDLSTQRCETFLRMGDYEQLIANTRVCMERWPDKPVFPYYLFCAETARGDYDAARAVFRRIVRSGPAPGARIEDCCAKYVFDTLAAGRSWHPPQQEPAGTAFLPMVEAEESYHRLSAKARRVATDGFTAQWSPEGSKLAFSLGVHGYNGIALFDPLTRETDLLIAPGKDPVWSPDGRYIAFVRDRKVLRLPELATVERRNQEQPPANEEVWVMNADGTRPRRLARGHCPSWKEDSTCIYYHSWVDRALYSISVTASEAEPPRWIAPCSTFYPSLSPNGQRFAYVEGRSLKVMDLASQTPLAQWQFPFPLEGGLAWSPKGDELSVGNRSVAERRAGLWICRFGHKEPIEILDGQVDAGSWSAQGKKLAFNLGFPFFEVWTADLDSKTSNVAALGPAQTTAGYLRELIAWRTRRIAADPADANNYLHRAEYYRTLHESRNLRADARRYWAALEPGVPPGFQLAGPWTLMRAFNGPLASQIVVFAEKQEDGMLLLRIAFGQKGRCEMKVFEIPMVVASLLGLCLLPDLQMPAARADFVFGRPVNLGPTVNSPQAEGNAVLSPDGLELYFASNRPGGYGDFDIWVSKRANIEDPWGPPVNLGPGINSSAYDYPSNVSPDGLTLYLYAQTGLLPDLYTATRPTRDAPWGPRVNTGPVLNGPEGGSDGRWGSDYIGVVSPDDLELFYASWRAGCIGMADIFVSTRATPSDPWGPPVNLGPLVNTSGRDFPMGITSDGLTLFICADNRPGGFGGWDMWMSHRPYKGAPWSEPVNLGPSVNTPRGDMCGITPDGRWAYGFHDVQENGSPLGATDLWMAPIIPIVDFNGDGKVDGKEVLAMAKHWGQSKSLCDIGPTPLGDGVVDVNDLTVLAGYVGPELNDPSLVVHWALDETAGMTAADSAGENNAMVLGGATWQPDGRIGGALAFDGKDDFALSAKTVLDPTMWPLSVIAWIKGGGPNRVIVSQSSGADWLSLNLYGMLATDLKADGRDGKNLSSDAHVLDDQWHRVVMTWDGTYRTLQMDGVEVARDTQANLATCSGNLQIGCGKTLLPTTFWTGLIDDVRIYNRAVQP